MASENWKTEGFGFDVLVIISVLLVLFVGHLVQIAIWAMLFVEIGRV